MCLLNYLLTLLTNIEAPNRRIGHKSISTGNNSQILAPMEVYSRSTDLIVSLQLVTDGPLLQ